MSGKQRVKMALLWTLRAGGAFALARWLTRRGGVIIGWHGVSLQGEEAILPSYFLAPDTLRKRLAHLQKHFEIVPLRDFVEQHAAGSIRPRQAVLTFDDAMYDMLAAGDKVLREFNAPATLYTISSSLDEPTRAHGLMLQYILLTSPLQQSPAGLLELEAGLPMSTEEQRLACQQRLNRARIQLPRGESSFMAFVERIAAAFEVDLSDHITNRVWDYSTIDEVRQLSEKGYAMQPHSHAHRNSTEILDTLAADTRTCKEKVEAVTGQPAVDYCYPSGFWNHEAARIVAAEGMQSGVTCNVGHNFPQTPVMALRRYMDGETFTQLEFEFVVSGLKWLIDSLRRPAEKFDTQEVS